MTIALLCSAVLPAASAIAATPLPATATTNAITPSTSAAVAAPAAAPCTTATCTVTLRVESARTWIPSGLTKGTVIPMYTWVLVRNDVGDPTRYGTTLGATSTDNSNYACSPQSMGGDPAYPANCKWPSIHSMSGGTPGQVVARGTQDDFNLTTGIDFTRPGFGAGKYMISVFGEGFTVPGCTVSPTVTCHADGFKLDGQWFEVPNTSGQVVVDLQPYPLPLTTVRMKVWNDTQTNGAYDTGEAPLAGFEGHISDVLSNVTTDWYGNPICTTYQHATNGLMLFDPVTGKPLVQTVGGHCFSDANGVITIPYLGPNRYAATVTAPNGQVWYQTSTLEGWHDWDVWAIEGWDGYDPEFVQGAEPFPFAEFGFVQIQNKLTTATTGGVSGRVAGVAEFAPAVGGMIPGFAGQQLVQNISQPLLSLSDLNGNDQTVFVGRGNADGTFSIGNVPDGDYILAYWDEDQAYLLTEVNVSVTNGAVVDLGILDAGSWHSHVHGTVCLDANRNGKCDPGEVGIPNLPLNLLGRDNSLQFYGDNTAITLNDGTYSFPRTYPLGQFVVTQGYWEQYYTVGTTYQTNNQPTETTVMANGGFVDVSTFNLIGMTTRLDWAVHPYETDPALGPTTGGIVGEAVYDLTRNELDASLSLNESYQPGIPGLTMHLYYPVPCTVGGIIPPGDTCTLAASNFSASSYYLTDSTGAYVHGFEASSPYITETWQRPTDCVARTADGTPVQERVLPPSTGGHDCLEAPLMSSQVGDNGKGSFMQVNGNYGFTTISTDSAGRPILDANGQPTSVEIPPGDWIVQAGIPADPNTAKPLWNVTKEEDINIMTGDKFVAAGETPLNPPTPVGATTPGTPAPVPAIPPFPCAGALHTVHVVATHADAHFDELNPSTTSGVYNPDFVAGGGSPYEGQRKPLCDQRLVTVRAGRSATPNFYLFTETPLPTRIFGIMVDDLNLSVKSTELFYGEKKGLGNVPIGIYDFSNRLLTTIQTDPHGAFEVILPSTSSYNCPLPAGPCPSIYRFLGNDPGQPGHPNPGYDPTYRTIGAFFEAWPGLSLPADLAPSPVAMGTGIAGTQTTKPAACLVNDPAQPTAPKVPELFAIDTPYVQSETGAARNRTLTGQNFGATRGSGNVTLDGTALPSANIISWADNQIVFRAPAVSTSFTAGPKQLGISTNASQSTVNAITFHVLGTGYTPTIYEVGPGLTGTRRYNATGNAHAIQQALDAAAAVTNGQVALVVVYPNTAEAWNPTGSYFENVIVHVATDESVKLQGVGPGGVRPDGTFALGSVLDGLGFGTDSARDTAWQATLSAIGTIIGPNGNPVDVVNAAVPEGEVVLFVSTAPNHGPVALGLRPSIDGFMIQNGNVMDFVPNTAVIGEGAQILPGNNAPTNANQGGGIAAFASIQNLEITNNVLRSNAGAYAGAIRIGTPLVGDNNMTGLHIARNRILSNGGTNLAGAVGIFTGATGYEINNNDICGNFSAEYGGGISHFGRSNGGKIHDNRVYFNGSYDEGAGIMIAGELPLNPTTLSAGAGAVDIYNNIIQSNLAGDDGGGLRFLTAGNFPFNVYNNFIVNNISAHEGGGVAIDNAPKLRFFNNTVMKNLTTATASTSNGLPAPAGLTTARNSALLQATLPTGSPLFSNPLMFNNIFWDNRAGTWNAQAALVRGIGGTDAVGNPDLSPINHWDMGVPGTAFTLSPTYSVLQTTTSTVSSPTNRSTDPNIIQSYDTSVVSLPWRGNGNFVANVIIALDVPASIMGNYHLAPGTSSAVNNGTASVSLPVYQRFGPAPQPTTLAAPAFDIDNQARPNGSGFDIGADERSGAAPAADPPAGGGGGGGAAPAAPAPSNPPSTLALRPKPAALENAPFSYTVTADAYHAEWVAQSAYPTAAPGQVVEWVVAFQNTGTAGWYKGAIGANAALGSSQPLNNEFAEALGMDPGNWQYPSRFAVQTTDYVGPGQIGWFVIQIKAPTTPGSYRIHLRPVIDGLSWLEDYGVYFDLTVTAPKTVAPASTGSLALYTTGGAADPLNAPGNLVARAFADIAGGTLQ